MSTLRTLALATLLAAATGLAQAKDCSSMTADGDDLVAPPVKATKAAAKEERATPTRQAQRPAVNSQSTQRTAAVAKAAEPQRP